MKFDKTSCSQCGGEFGPGNGGYSHCIDHNGFANLCGYSDITPHEVVKVVSDKTLEIREMDAKLADGEKPEIIPGGFAGHCTNQRSLKYDITSNPENSVIRIRLSRSGVWKDAHGRKYSLSDKPVYFYDYNF